MTHTLLPEIMKFPEPVNIFKKLASDSTNLLTNGNIAKFRPKVRASSFFYPQ